MRDEKKVLMGYSIELLTDYAAGLVSEEVRKRIDQDRFHSDGLNGVIEGINALVSMGYEDPEEIDELLKSEWSDVNVVSKERADVHSMNGFSLIYRIAAVFALVALTAGFWVLNQDETISDIVVSELSSHYRSPVVLRGEVDQNLWTNAVSEYKGGEFSAAMSSFSEYVKMRPEDTRGYFYLGLSALYSDNLEDAVLGFEKVLDSGSRFKPNAQWFLALTYLRSGEDEAARTLLTQISKEGSFKKDVANRILEKY